MKIFLAILIALLPMSLWAQPDTAAKAAAPTHSRFERHSVIVTLSAGAIDRYRQSYSMPSGFEKGNTIGFAPIYGKVEYAVRPHISIAASFCYDGFDYNYNQLYKDYNSTAVIKRYRVDHFSNFSEGLTAYYHFVKYIHVRNLDPFVGVGVAISNTSHSAWPQGDSAIAQKNHTASVVLKAGARYYLSSRFSLYGDVGYDDQSIFSLGISCRFFSKREHPELKN